MLTAGQQQPPSAGGLSVVAAREGCSPEQAREHVRAIFAALRDAVTPGEFDDITSQLDRSHRELLPERVAVGR